MRFPHTHHHYFLVPPQKNAARADSDEEPDYPAALFAAESEAFAALGVSRRAYKSANKGARGAKHRGQWHLNARGGRSSSSATRMASGESRNSATSAADLAANGRGGKFPERLYELVSAECGSGIVRWAANGKAFLILDEERMVRELLPKYEFKATKLTSLQRNLNMYGFVRLAAKGEPGGAYAHPGFQRGMTLAQVREVEVRRYANGSPLGGDMLSQSSTHSSSGARSRGDDSAGSESDDEIENDDDEDDDDAGSSGEEELDDDESDEEEAEDVESAIKYPMLPCPVCNKFCRGSSGLANHVKWHTVAKSSLHHKTDTKPKSARGNGASGAELKLDAAKKPRRLPCPVCKKKCKGTSGLANHVKWHSAKERAAARRAAGPSNKDSKLATATTAAANGSVSSKTQGKNGGQNAFVCFVCRQSLATFSSLALHVREHTGERFGVPIRMCGVCGKTCAGGAALANHVKMCSRRRQGLHQRIVAAQKPAAKVKKVNKVVDVSEEEEEDEESEDEGGGDYEVGEVDVDDEDDEEDEDGSGKGNDGPQGIIDIRGEIENARINLRANRGGNRRHLLRCKLCRKGFASTQGFSSHMQMHQRGEAPAQPRSSSPHSGDLRSSSSSSDGSSSSRPQQGGEQQGSEAEVRDRSGKDKQNTAPFPVRLHQMLTEACEEYPKAVAWLPKGEPGFQVLDQEVFMGQIMPRWGFKATQFSSFHRNLQVYGFTSVKVVDSKPSDKPKSSEVTSSDIHSDSVVRREPREQDSENAAGESDGEKGDEDKDGTKDKTCFKKGSLANGDKNGDVGVDKVDNACDDEVSVKVDEKSGNLSTSGDIGDKNVDKSGSQPSGDDIGEKGVKKDDDAKDKSSSISSGDEKNGETRIGKGDSPTTSDDESSSAIAEENADKSNEKNNDVSEDEKDDKDDTDEEEATVAAYSHPLFSQHLDSTGLAALAAGCRLGTSAGTGALGGDTGATPSPRLALGEAPRQRKPSAKAVDLEFSMRAKYKRKNPIDGEAADSASAGVQWRSDGGASSPQYPPFLGSVVCRIGGARVWPFLEVEVQTSNRSVGTSGDGNSRAQTNFTPSPVGVEARSPDSVSLSLGTADRPSSAPPLETSLESGRSIRGPSSRVVPSITIAGLTTRESLFSVARRNLLMQQMEWRQEDGSAVPESSPLPTKGEACSGGGGFLHKIYSILHRQPVFYGSKGKSVLLTHAQYCTVRWDFERDSSGTILSNRYDSVMIDSTIVSLLGSGILFEAAEFKSILRQFTQAGFEVRRMNDATTPSSVGKFACDPGDEEHFSVRYSFQGLSPSLPLDEFVRLAEASIERKKAKPPRRPTVPSAHFVPMLQPTSSLDPAPIDEQHKRSFEQADERSSTYEEPEEVCPGDSTSSSGSSGSSSGGGGSSSSVVITSSNTSSTESSSISSNGVDSGNIGSSNSGSGDHVDKRMRISTSEKPSLQCALCSKVCAGGAALANHMKMCTQKPRSKALNNAKKHNLVGLGMATQSEAENTAQKRPLLVDSSSQHYSRPAEAIAAYSPVKSFIEANQVLTSQTPGMPPTPGVAVASPPWTVPRLAVPALQSYRPATSHVGSVGPMPAATDAAWVPRPLAVPQVPPMGPVGPRAMPTPPAYAPYVPHCQQHPPSLPQVMRVPQTALRDGARESGSSKPTGASKEPVQMAVAQSPQLTSETDSGMRPPGL